MYEFTEETGPIDYLVVEYPSGEATGSALPALVDLVDRGIIRVLDLAFLRKGAEGSAEVVDLMQLVSDPVFADLALFEGAHSGLLTQEDLDEVSTALEPGSAAAVMVYENVWVAPLAVALRRAGARLVANGRIPVQELIAVLDELDQEQAVASTATSNH